MISLTEILNRQLIYGDRADQWLSGGYEKGIDCERARGNFWRVMEVFYIMIVVVVT